MKKYSICSGILSILVSITVHTDALSAQTMGEKKSKPYSAMTVDSAELERIKLIQHRLKEEGYYFGAIDGVKTSELRSAIKQWARDRD